MSEVKKKSLVEGAKKLSKGVKKPTKKVGFQKRRRMSMDQKLRKLAEEAVPGKNYTLEEIASVMGITRERVRQIEQRALMRLYPRLKKVLKEDGIDIEDLYAVLRNGKDQTIEFSRSV